MFDEDGRFSARVTVVTKGRDGKPQAVAIEGSTSFDLQGLYHEAMPPERICKYHAELRRRTPEHQRPSETACFASFTPEQLCSRYLKSGFYGLAANECRKAAATLESLYGDPAGMHDDVLADHARLRWLVRM
jgi:hypothetical protein